MPTLKSTPNEYFEVTCNDLNDFIAEVTGVEGFRVEETEWWREDANKTIFVDGDFLTEADYDYYDSFLCGNTKIDFDILMGILCADGWIPKGYYIVFTDW